MGWWLWSPECQKRITSRPLRQHKGDINDKLWDFWKGRQFARLIRIKMETLWLSSSRPWVIRQLGSSKVKNYRPNKQIPLFLSRHHHECYINFCLVMSLNPLRRPDLLPGVFCTQKLPDRWLGCFYPFFSLFLLKCLRIIHNYFWWKMWRIWSHFKKFTRK